MGQLEEMYAFFKEKEHQERMIGKRYVATSVQWVLDCGALHYMTNNAQLLHNLIQLPKPIFITTANEVTVTIEQAGTVVVSPEIILQNVLYSPNFTCNLISIRQLTKDIKCLVTYGEHSCLIHDRTSKRLIGAGDLRNRVYCLKVGTEATSLVAIRQKKAVL